MSGVTTRERLIDAAFALFDERGFDATTVDHIAERAGVGRTTFFRHFPTKEDVIFPDHDAIIAAVGDRLRASTDGNALLAVTEAARLVLRHYLEEGERARTRYRLTSTVSALRDREIASLVRYQHLFREFAQRWMGVDDGSSLLAELMANAVVTAHNHVLRRWLRGETTAPEQEFDAAMARTVALFDRARTPAAGTAGTDVVVVRTTRATDEVVAALRAALAD
jgi:AcrR family transcriptional regulator